MTFVRIKYLGHAPLLLKQVGVGFAVRFILLLLELSEGCGCPFRELQLFVVQEEPVVQFLVDAPPERASVNEGASLQETGHGLCLLPRWWPDDE